MGELEKEKASLIATMNSETAAAATATTPASGSNASTGRSKPSAMVEALRERLKVITFEWRRRRAQDDYLGASITYLNKFFVLVWSVGVVDNGSLQAEEVLAYHLYVQDFK